MPGYCVNTTWLDGKISSVRSVPAADWMNGADIKSKNWNGPGGYRSRYACVNSK